MRLCVYYMSRSMQKIHRRKNQQIVKDFLCTHGCGKAYGSYAALYTHIKNKHPNMGTYSQIKSNLVRPKATGRKGRPLKKQKEEVVKVEVSNQYQCKICQEDDCVCDEEMGYEEIERTIGIMEDRRFVELINCIGTMNFGDNFTWVRNTEDDYSPLSYEEVRTMALSFLETYQLTKSLRLSEIWIDFLSFSSKYWDKRYINELYNSILLMRSYENVEDIRIFLNNHLEFENMRKCAELKAKEFMLLMEIVKNI